MADNVAITAGVGTSIAADDIASVWHQRVKLSLGADGSATDLVGTATRGAYVDPKPTVVRLPVTPTVSNGAIYAAKDQVGGLMTFSGAARVSGASLWIQAAQIEDKGQQMGSLDLVLFDRSVSVSTDNNIFAPSDADMAFCVGFISFTPSDYADLSTNSVAHRAPGLQILLNGTDLFGVLVARSTPTYTSTSDLIVTLTILQD